LVVFLDRFPWSFLGHFLWPFDLLGLHLTAGRCSTPTMDKLARKIKYGLENSKLTHRAANHAVP
jgi:hypothetical protein